MILSDYTNANPVMPLLLLSLFVHADCIIFDVVFSGDIILRKENVLVVLVWRWKITRAVAHSMTTRNVIPTDKCGCCWWWAMEKRLLCVHCGHTVCCRHLPCALFSIVRPKRPPEQKRAQLAWLTWLLWVYLLGLR